MNKSVFKCLQNNCLKSCCGSFSGISKKLISLDGRPFSEIVLTDDDAKIFIENGLENFIEVGYSKTYNRYYKRMLTDPDGNCISYKSGRCSIYEFRPTLCKAFPFYFDAFAGLCVINCAGVILTNTDIEDCKSYIEEARKMYYFWLDFYSKNH
jgi:Fe-S-cluster containining protein